ncbi:MAG: VOC family protein [Actinobacteria bacterium]|nr:VOC family protein [Actinomycetota bacterium]
MVTFGEAFPIISVADVDRAVDFYCSTFGFEVTYTFDDAGTTAFAFLRLDPLGIGVAARKTVDDPDFALWIYADNVDEAAERLRAAGAAEVLAPTDQPWGERMCSFRDADGHLVHVGMRS